MDARSSESAAEVRSPSGDRAVVTESSGDDSAVVSVAETPTASTELTKEEVQSPAPDAAEAEADLPTPPSMSPFAIFLLFLSFGVRAFGGPVAQINIMKDHLVTHGKWISPQRFNRVYAAYQVLPGPEATELACYFGILAGGRLGGLLAGLGFILPGFCLMLLFAWFYERYGITNGVFVSVFYGLQPAVCAMVFRAAHKIGESVCRHHATKEIDWRLFLVVGLAAFESVLGVNFFVTKAHLASLYFLLYRGWHAAAAFWAVAPIAGFIAITVVLGPMGQLVPQGVGVAAALGNTPAAEFVVGLVGGLVSFGGAYTAIPFMQAETVTGGHWIPNQLFLDSLAVCALLPTPLVMFATMIGYGANGVVGAVVMTIGMFLPALSLPVLLHSQLDKLVNNTGVVAVVLDGVAATTVGLICVTAVQLLRTAVQHQVDAVIFIAALQALYSLRTPWAPVLVIVATAMAGYVLYF
jgi:chromate transporter